MRKYILSVIFFLVTWTPRQADAVPATMTWTDTSSGTTQEDFFEIQSATTPGGTYTTIGSAGQDAQSFVVDAGTPGTTMWYRLRGVNAIGNGTFSTAVSYTVPAVGEPLPFVACLPTPLPAGLVLAMGMNENTGTAVSDSSGQGNQGTLSGATWTTSGKYGAALTFDGVNDWVTVADSPSLHLSTGITMSAWVFPTALNGGTTNGWRVIAMKEASPTGSYEFYANGDTSVPRGYISVGGVDSFVSGTGQLTLNVWTHMAFTFDGATLRLYVNGVQVGTTAKVGTALAGTGPLRIGGDQPFSEFFAGRIDELRIYDRALSVTEIVTDRDTPIL